MGQKSAQLPNFENVQYPKEESKQKHFFAKVITEVAKVYLCEKKIGGFWHLNDVIEKFWKIAEVVQVFVIWRLLTRC